MWPDSSQQTTKIVVNLILVFALPCLTASRMAHWYLAALFALSGFLILGAAVSVFVAADVTTLYVFSIVNSVGSALMVMLVQTMPKLFLMEFYEPGSEEMDVMLVAAYAYQNMFRYGPFQFMFTVFLFYTTGEQGGPTTAVVLAISASMAALTCVPLFWARLRNAMVKRSDLLSQASVRCAFERDCGTRWSPIPLSSRSAGRREVIRAAVSD